MDLQEVLRGVRRADQDYGLIEANDVIAVGVSGGKDSMVLLTALHMYARFPHKQFRVVGIHIEMGFPDMDFQAVDAFCQAQGIELHHVPSSIYEILKRRPGKNGALQCSLCSKFKKASVIEAAKALHCTKVAFGHHCDDAVETLFLNMIHGGKIATFLPKMYMDRTDTTFIRPFIYTHESDILRAQQKNNIPFVKSTCPNDGFTERQEMKELLEQLYQAYPMAKKNFRYMLHNHKQVALWETLADQKEKDHPVQSVNGDSNHI